MKTLVKQVNQTEPETAAIEQAAGIIRTGGLVAFPTETVYGLGADALMPGAAQKIYEAKGRPSDNPLIVHISDFEALTRIAAHIPPAARKLADAFWPGPLTMIFRKTPEVPYETTGGLETVAVRMPDHPVALALIRESGGYIAAPSANTSGKPSPTCAGHVISDLDGKVDMVLDGGQVGIGIESTIVDLSVEPPMILRPGFITSGMLMPVIGSVQDDPSLTSEDASVRPKAPGMKYRHYAPKADLILVEGNLVAVSQKINEFIAELGKAGKKAGVICTDESVGQYHGAVVKSIGSRKDPSSIAHNLYAVLREFDDIDVDCIFSESFSADGFGQAVMNRLYKAAGRHVVSV